MNYKSNKTKIMKKHKSPVFRVDKKTKVVYIRNAAIQLLDMQDQEDRLMFYFCPKKGTGRILIEKADLEEPSFLVCKTKGKPQKSGDRSITGIITNANLVKWIGYYFKDVREFVLTKISDTEFTFKPIFD